VHSNLFICGALFATLAVAPARVVADPVHVANAIRSQGCGDFSAVDLPLRAQTQLDEAARHMAGGDGLETALSGSGYRATRSASVHIRTTRGDEGVADMLARRFCAIVTDSGLRDIGAYQRADETWIVLAAPLSLQDPDTGSPIAGRVLELINEARSGTRSCGHVTFAATRPLSPVTALEAAALAHAQDMAANSFLDHSGSDGSMPADRATRAGYAWNSIAENVAVGQTTAEAVVDTWLESPGHCANLMSPRFSDTGVAYAINPTDEGGIYWVQIYAARE
jgi:uncharacterized protein YkwD